MINRKDETNTEKQKITLFSEVMSTFAEIIKLIKKSVEI